MAHRRQKFVFVPAATFEGHVELAQFGGALLHTLLQFDVEIAQRLFGLATRCDVLDNDKGYRLAVVHDAIGGNGDMHGMAVGGHVLSFFVKCCAACKRLHYFRGREVDKRIGTKIKDGCTTVPALRNCRLVGLDDV